MKVGTDRRVKETRCMRCDTALDAATPIDHDSAPTPGDVSICLVCNHIAVFTRSGKLREPRSDELRVIMADQRIITARGAVTLLHLKEEKPN